MRRDDVRTVLDAMASEVAGPPADASVVVRRGRSRIRWRRVAAFGVAAVVLAAAVSVGAATRDNGHLRPAPATHVATSVAGGQPSSAIVAPAPDEAWKCRNPIEYTDDGGRTWRATELAGVRGGALSCAAIAGGTAWATAPDVSGQLRVFRVRDGGAHVDRFAFPVSDASIAPTFIDADHGWMSVSPFSRESQGVDLYRTADGGETWSRVGESVQLGALVFANAETGWSMHGTVVLQTLDGGSTWNAVHRTSQRLFGVAAIPNGVVVWGGERSSWGYYKTFFDATTDRGRTWTEQRGLDDFVRADVMGLFTASDDSHWELLSGNELRVTADAGRTWQSRPVIDGFTNPREPASVQFPTPEVGWVTDDTGTILRTTDGGRDWHDVTKGAPHAPAFKPTYAGPVSIPLAFASPTEGWLCDPSTMEYTTDAGATWKNVAVPGNPPVAPRTQQPVCAAVPGGDAWLLTATAHADGLQVVHVSDGGRRVETSSFPPLRSDWTVRDLAFADREHGWAFAIDAAGGASTMMDTTDGGRTWHDDAPVRGFTVFGSSRDGWAALELLPSELAHTTDGGRNWERVQLDYGGAGTLRPIGATGDTVVALAWSPATSDIRPSFAVTTDGGDSWAFRRAPRGFAAPIGEIAASATDANHWQIAAGNELWTTDDGGRTWRDVADFAGIAQITDVRFLTPEIGFVSATGTGVTANGTVVLHTTDGGESWSTADIQSPPLAGNTPVINFPGGIIGCPTRPLTPPPPGNPPAGLIPAAKAYVGAGPNGWTPDSIVAYRIGDTSKGQWGSLFALHVGSCGRPTIGNAWAVELNSNGIKGQAYIPRAYLAFAHYADGWHVFGRYP